MPQQSDNIDVLHRQREELREQIARIKDLRPGSLIEHYRRCGKKSCRCAAEGHPGHGPQWLLTHKVGGKSVARVIPAQALEQTRAQVQECKRFRELTQQFIAVSEQLCQARLQTKGSTASQKKTPGGA